MEEPVYKKSEGFLAFKRLPVTPRSGDETCWMLREKGEWDQTQSLVRLLHYLTTKADLFHA